MKIETIFFQVSFLVSLILFAITTNFYVPRPYLKDFLVIDPNNPKIKPVVFYPEKLNNKKTNKKIKVGETFLVSHNKEISFLVTPIALWSEKEFNLPDYFDFFQKIIIDAEEVVSLGVNNYGLKIFPQKKQYQACLIKSKDKLFKYSGKNDTVHRYNDYDYWLSIYVKEINTFFKSSPKDNFNCLLITTENPQIFEDKSINLLNLISKYFIY